MGRRSMRLVKTEGAEEDAETPVKAAPDAPRKVKEKKKKKHKKNKENRAKSQVKEAVKEAAVSVVMPPFQRKREDGSTSLAILTPGDGVIPGTERDRPVSLGALLGRVRAGTATLASFREDRRNVAKPMYPIYYGGYSSHGPTHDSTFANLTETESAMVGPYFDFRSMENEELIRGVCGADYSSTFVDHLLDLFQGKEVTDIVTKDMIAANKKEKQMEKADNGGEIDFDMLKTLEADGIDMSFMSTLQAAYEIRQEQEMKDLSLDEQLQLTAHLIDSLASAQSSRLSAPPPSSLSAIPGPGAREARLAERVVTKLTSLAGQAPPSGLVDLVQVRRAMGVRAPPGPQEGVLTNGGEVLTNGVEGGHGEAMECA